MLTDDSAIINACLDGESEAFGILVDKYKAGIFAFVYAKLGNFHDAQDVTQEVFLEAYRKLRSLRKWESFSFWLYRIASTLCKNWKKKESKYSDSESFEDLSSEILANPSINSYRENALYESVRDELNSLPEIYREVLILHYFVGMDSKEIAKALGTSPTAIRMRISRAREQLREEMIAIMGTAFNQQKLQAKFTFNIVEAIKRIKINPSSQTTKGLPWGLSLATGLLVAIISINPMLLSFVHLGTPIFSPLPSETKVLKIGEIPVDVVKTSNLTFISSNMGKGNGGEPKQPDENAFFMSPQADGGTWVKKADMPAGLGYNCFSVVNDKIYVIGGLSIINGKEVAISTVYEYDPKADTWSKKADMPTPRAYFGSYVIDGKIYAIGGYDMANIISAIEEYDPITDKWEKKADCPAKMSAFTVSQVNGEIYVIGGNEGDNAVLKYNPKTSTWTRKADMPTKRVYLTSCVLNDKIYVFGGTSDVGISLLSTTEIYDPSTDTWSKGSDMPKPRWLLSSCAVNGLIYVMGGYLDNVGHSPSPVEIYDPVKDKWTESENLSIARDVMSSYPVIDGKIYVIGGYNTNRGYLSDIYEYTPEVWRPVSPSGKLPTKWGMMKQNK